MNRPLHPLAFGVSVVWTLALLLLGSVVHATESSLACPDWPTCFGTMMPEMTGGVFWEHLHRLVAGGLILVFGLASYLAWKELAGTRRWIAKASALGVVLLLVQAVFGGLTVLLRLPNAISTTHLALALTFLALVVVLAAATSPRLSDWPAPGQPLRRILIRGGGWTSALVFAQSLLGGYVRHSDAGLACGTGVLCNGGILPPGFNRLVGVQFSHRLLGILTVLAVLWLVVVIFRAGAPRHVGRTAVIAGGLVVSQVTLGFLSVSTVLAVLPVSLHTLVAALLLSACVLLAAWGQLTASSTTDRVAAAETMAEASSTSYGS